MKIVTLGGGFVSEHLPYYHILDRVDCSSKQIGAILDSTKPDVIINCIGKTGVPNIDWCENNKEITSISNTVIPLILADECAKRSIHMIHIGSGCIFYGNSPHASLQNKEDAKSIDSGWEENDFANPESLYSCTKYAGDLILGKLKNCSVLRIRMPISDKNHNRNLINKLKNYNKIINIQNSVTFMDDLINVIDWVIKESQIGIFHVTNPEPLTAVRVMEEYQKYVPTHKFEIISENDLDKLTLAKRSNCILNSNKLRSAGYYMRSTEQALVETMKKYIQNI